LRLGESVSFLRKRRERNLETKKGERVLACGGGVFGWGEGGRVWPKDFVDLCILYVALTDMSPSADSERSLPVNSASNLMFSRSGSLGSFA